MTNFQLQKRGGGSAIFISSIGGFQPISALGPYSVSKTALIGLTKALGAETAADNIRVNCVAPGVVRSTSKPNSCELYAIILFQD